jgi:starch synthase
MKLKIVFAASESLPFVKTGGLADVVFSLTKNLAKAGHDVYLILPRYYKINKTDYNCKPTGIPLGVPVGAHEKWAAVYTSDRIEGVKTFFVEHDSYFGRDGLYDDGYTGYADNAERFTFYCRSVLQICLAHNIAPDIIHCNDWQTGLIPIYLKTLYKHHKQFAHAKSVLTLHNLGYQGIFDKHDIVHTQLGWEAYTENCLKSHDKINFLQGAILWADAITTVSRKYAEEIQTKEFGYDLAPILVKRTHQLFGITNGVDYEKWHPTKDTSIPAKYSISHLSGKTICKEYLQHESKLPVNPNIPLLATVSRVTHQKGIDLLYEALTLIKDSHDFQFILLGNGDADILDHFRKMAHANNRRFAVYEGFDEQLAHRIEAGADIFCMPSRYEPCGLNQMYSLKYGTIPVVRATGGLDDTVEDWNSETKTGTGFKFKEESPACLAEMIIKALSHFHNIPDWNIMRKNAMNFSILWKDVIPEYEKVYNFLLNPSHKTC